MLDQWYEVAFFFRFLTAFIQQPALNPENNISQTSQFLMHDCELTQIASTSGTEILFPVFQSL